MKISSSSKERRRRSSSSSSPLLAAAAAAAVLFVVPSCTELGTCCQAFVISPTTVGQRCAAARARARAVAPKRNDRPIMSSARASRIAPTSSSLYSSSSSDLPTSDTCDVLVLGSGPAARALATLLSSPTCPDDSPPGLDVIMADANFDRAWPPNYGVWEDEWDAINDLYESFGRILGKDRCVDRRWGVTDCYFGGSFDIPTTQRFRVDRPYCRIDKDALRDELTPTDRGYRVLRANHMSKASSTNLYEPSGTLTHDAEGSTITLQSKDGAQQTTVRTRLIVDCTGHETDLVLKDLRCKSRPAGFQIAYGALVTVDESSAADVTQIGPYDKEAMTLFDYRTDHFSPGSPELQSAERDPTFMYAMPLKDNRIFFEETSLVARPAISFQECKDRCFKRLEHLGIKVLDVEEEEFCYIPMGGPLPLKDQRIIGFGGAAAMVHPSTGYHLCRAMMGAGAVAKTIRTELGRPEADGGVDLDRAAAASYDSIWSPANIRQRNFAVFGGEFLMKQNVEGLRGFFDGFFRLPLEMWGGFLAGWPGLPNNDRHETWTARIWFGLTFVSKLPLQVAADMLASIVTYSVTGGEDLIQSVTPLLGDPQSYAHVDRPTHVGDVAAKSEARRMIHESRVTEDLPVAFGSSSPPKEGVVAGSGGDDRDAEGDGGVDAKNDGEEVAIKSFQ